MGVETIEHMGTTYVADHGRAMERKGRAWAAKLCRELKEQGVAAYPRQMGLKYYTVALCPAGVTIIGL
jgi:hypothetical protein